MATFRCFDCDQEFPVKTDGGTGYAVLHRLNEKVCYACAAKRDRAAASRGKPLVAYVGGTVGDGMGVERHGSTSRRYLTTWGGERIGYCKLDRGWRVRSWIGSRMYQVYATIEGVTFTGRSFGEGMAVSLRPVKSTV